MDELSNSVEDKSAIVATKSRSAAGIASENLTDSDSIQIETSVQTSAPTQDEPLEREETIIAETSLKPPIQKFKPIAFFQIDLANRLDVDSSTVGRNKLKDNFQQWSKEKDPNGIAWRFNPETSYYYPIYDGRLIAGLFEVVVIAG